jgi:sulfur carrier protein
MRVVVNGLPHELDDGATVESVVESAREQPATRGIAVAVDGEVVPRSSWGRTPLSDGARVEIVVAVQGG